MNNYNIVDYEGDKIYKLIKNPITGKWEDQTAQSISKNYKKGFDCPCKEYLNEYKDTNYKQTLFNVPRHKYGYFISKHVTTRPHKEWISSMNENTVKLENKSNKELVERIDELSREKRKDKVEFRKYIELRDKEICNLKDQLTDKNQQLQDKSEIIEDLKYKLNQKTCNVNESLLINLMD